MAISAQLVRELRIRTGAGMMECKQVLVETGGDLDAAARLLRERGAAKADKKAARVAAEGIVAIAADGAEGALVEINCETDFVAGGEPFRDFAAAVAELVLREKPADPEALSEARLPGGTSVEQTRRELIARIGENISVRRMGILKASGTLAIYSHNGRIGVLVALAGDGGDEALGRDVAMHVAASAPVCVAAEDVPAGQLDKEREILRAQAAGEGKPDNIVDKMVEGRLRKYLAEVTLLGQPFVKNPDQTVGALLEAAGARVEAFLRFEVGEGIDKPTDDFASEVMAQVRGE